MLDKMLEALAVLKPEETGRISGEIINNMKKELPAEKERAVVAKAIKEKVSKKAFKILDKKKNGLLEGKTRTNYIVHFPGDPELAGKIVRIRLTHSKAIHVMGEMVN